MDFVRRMFAANIKRSKYCLPCRFSQADLRAVVLTAGKRSDFFRADFLEAGPGFAPGALALLAVIAMVQLTLTPSKRDGTGSGRGYEERLNQCPLYPQ